jgi:hypothetical protein
MLYLPINHSHQLSYKPRPTPCDVHRTSLPWSPRPEWELPPSQGCSPPWWLRWWRDLRNLGTVGITDLPSGKRLHNYGKIHHFSWENSLFLWPFSIATLNYQRVCPRSTVFKVVFSNYRWKNEKTWEHTCFPLVSCTCWCSCCLASALTCASKTAFLASWMNHRRCSIQLPDSIHQFQVSIGHVGQSWTVHICPHILYPSQMIGLLHVCRWSHQILE